MNAFFLLTLAAAVSMLIVPVAWRLAPRLGMVDLPDPRKIHTAPVPRVGGWGITIGSLVPLLLLYKLDQLLQSFVIGSLTLFCFGLWDDARQIDHWKKFAGQILATGVVVYYGDLYVSRLPFLDMYVLDPVIGKPFTMFALIGVINAINHSDGLDGLAGGESMLSLIAIAFLSYLSDSALVLGIALATMGGTFGFLRYNTHPARVFMGDTGSQVLGFTLGFLAVYLTQVAHTAVSAALPLLLLGLPLADILSVLFQRIRAGMSWFKATRNHVHHRLLDLGFSHFETVVIIYSVHAALVVGAVLMRYQSDIAVAAAYFGIVGLLFGALSYAENRKWTMPRVGPGKRALVPAVVRRWRDATLIRALPLAFIATVVPAFMAISSLWVQEIPRDFGIVAGVLAVVMAVEMARNRSADSLLVRAAIYCSATFSAYLFVTYPGDSGLAVAHATNIGMACVAIAIGIVIRFLSDQKFVTTPTDYLIVFGLLALAAFDSVDIKASSTTQFASYAIVLFYSGELVVSRLTSIRHPFYWAALASLVIMATRSLLFAS